MTFNRYVDLKLQKYPQNELLIISLPKKVALQAILSPLVRKLFSISAGGHLGGHLGYLKLLKDIRLISA